MILSENRYPTFRDHALGNSQANILRMLPASRCWRAAVRRCRRFAAPRPNSSRCPRRLPRCRRCARRRCSTRRACGARDNGMADWRRRDRRERGVRAAETERGGVIAADRNGIDFIQAGDHQVAAAVEPGAYLRIARRAGIDGADQIADRIGAGRLVGRAVSAVADGEIAPGQKAKAQQRRAARERHRAGAGRRRGRQPGPQRHWKQQNWTRTDEAVELCRR